MLKQQYQKLRFCSKGNLKRWGCKTIPVLSVFALLGFSTVLLNPMNNGANEAYAVYGGGLDGDETSSPITPSEALSSSASLVIDNGTIRDTIAATPGELFYTTHQVSISATSVTGYSLTISTTTPSITANGTTLTGAGGKTATSMDNQWGYAWIAENGDPNTASYNSLTTGGTDLAQSSDVKNNSINYTKKLVFGAKFNDQAGNGHYTANVNLNLTVTPRQITSWNDLEYMQDITPALCKSAPANAVKTLKDVRDQQEYTVQKVGDSCWMTQNLRLAAGTTISDKDSDLNNIRSYTLPSNTTGGFSGDNTAQQMRNADNETYGAYYSWCAATANTCQINGTPIALGDATSSICPKGWKLPKGGAGTGTNDFALVVGLIGNVTAGNINHWSDLLSPTFAGEALTVNGVTWPAAGSVDTSGLQLTGSNGDYWSRTAINTSGAYLLSFYSNTLYPANYYYKYFGGSIRCVAENDAPLVSGFGGITKMQDMTSEVCSKASGSGQLYDSRDNSTYMVQKVGDKCWMTQNLRLAGGSKLTSADSDVSSDYTLPVAITTGFSNDNAAQQMRNANDSTYGAYYSWCAATANTCQINGTAIGADADASSSICPKGWQLPKGGIGTGTNDFAVVAGLSSTNIVANTSYWSSLSNPHFANSALTVNGATWAAAGLIDTYGPYGTDKNGDYWSRTAVTTSSAYGLDFGSASLNPAATSNRYLCIPVRCITK